MKKDIELNNQNTVDDEDMLPEYDFSKGVRGKHTQEVREADEIVIRIKTDKSKSSNSV